MSLLYLFFSSPSWSLIMEVMQMFLRVMSALLEVMSMVPEEIMNIVALLWSQYLYLPFWITVCLPFVCLSYIYILFRPHMKGWAKVLIGKVGAFLSEESFRNSSVLISLISDPPPKYLFTTAFFWNFNIEIYLKNICDAMTYQCPKEISIS